LLKLFVPYIERIHPVPGTLFVDGMTRYVRCQLEQMATSVKDEADVVSSCLA